MEAGIWGLQLSPLICGFAFHRFSSPWSSLVQKYEMQNSRNKPFLSFKLCAVLSSMMKSCAVQLPPAQDVTNPFVQRLHTVHASCLLVTE